METRGNPNFKVLILTENNGFVAHSHGDASNFEEPPKLGETFASTSADSAANSCQLDNLDEVLDALSDWEDQLRDVNFDDLEPRL